MTRLILASKSPARLDLLRHAGLSPEVIVSGVDESLVTDPRPGVLPLLLARAKGRDVAEKVTGDAVLVACDTLLEFEGRIHGKPGTADAARMLWRRMRRNQGVIHTGHYVWARTDGEAREACQLRSTVVHFADLDDREIDAYVATGEPERVAGGFTVDGRGGAYITAIDGDHFNVSGLSLPLFRQMVIDLGVDWPSLWTPHAP
ncbi:Maf family protein [Tessaracoccus caeni]|uniref:Maf family protein n=1 Tax=Tessaracoccus caeni TaxID=3031239 RepID=UPI0023DC50C2|nr:Maf family protein [Tessaracoccus caeni]MDF1488904.1 Maf family protein [Tessaracoccus caeni]